MRNRFRYFKQCVLRYEAVICFSALVLMMAGGSSSAVKPQTTCLNPPTVDITSPQVPTDVCIPDGFGGNPIQFFDDFSWRSFIALVWPARSGQRGTPDTALTVNSPGSRVFETYKSSWEIFHRDGSAPVAWNTYEASQFNACNQPVQFGDLVIASFSKFADIGQADFGTLVGPLVAQNMTYTRYLTSFNQNEFDQIEINKWYIRSNLGTADKPLEFKGSAIDVKSAWIDMTNIAHPERYYTRMAWVMDPATGQCLQKTIGLVGIHIVQKTPSRPQWIWTSFEQVDNISQTGGQAPFAFTDGTGTQMPSNNPIAFPPPESPPLKFNVQRLKPIHPSTQQTNAAYRQALAQQNSVWQFYQLVMTQWPLQLNPPQPIPVSQQGSPNFTFPGTGATTAFSNVTMETFDQERIRTGCMNCHNLTKAETDFLWVLNTHAFDPNGGMLLRDPAFRNLKQLLEVHRESEAQKMSLMLRSVKPSSTPPAKRRRRNR
jgi:hypothetical protein